MDLCKELVWRDPTDGLQYSRIKEVDRIYDFLAGLNPKFDVIRGHILGQRPIPSLMEVCSEIRLEEDHTSAMNISTTPSIDSAALMRGPLPMAMTSTMENQFLSVSIVKNNGIPKNIV